MQRDPHCTTDNKSASTPTTRTGDKRNAYIMHRKQRTRHLNSKDGSPLRLAYKRNSLWRHRPDAFASHLRSTVDSVADLLCVPDLCSLDLARHYSSFPRFYLLHSFAGLAGAVLRPTDISVKRLLREAKQVVCAWRLASCRIALRTCCSRLGDAQSHAQRDSQMQMFHKYTNEFLATPVLAKIKDDRWFEHVADDNQQDPQYQIFGLHTCFSLAMQAKVVDTIPGNASMLFRLFPPQRLLHSNIDGTTDTTRVLQSFADALLTMCGNYRGQNFRCGVQGRHTLGVLGRYTLGVLGRYTLGVLGRHTLTVLGRCTLSLLGPRTLAWQRAMKPSDPLAVVTSGTHQPVIDLSFNWYCVRVALLLANSRIPKTETCPQT